MAPRRPDFAQPQRFSTPWRSSSSDAVTHSPALCSVFAKAQKCVHIIALASCKTLESRPAGLVIASYASCRSLSLLKILSGVLLL